MQSDLNQRQSSFFIHATVFVNKKPTTPMIGPLKDLSFDIQKTIDYLRRNAVKLLVISEQKSNPIDDYNRDLKRRFDACYPTSKTQYNHDKRFFTDQVNAKQRSQEVGASTYNNDDIKIICSEVKNSKSIKSVIFRLIEDSNINLEDLIAAINDNPAIKEVYLECCGKLFVSEIKEIAKNRDLKVDVWGQSISETMDQIRRNSKKPPEIKTTFFANIDNWQVIDGFITVVGLATLALAFIAFEAASLNPLGIGLAVLGSGLIGAGLSHFFSPPKSSDLNKERPFNTEILHFLKGV